LPGPLEFVMGSPTTEEGRDDEESQHHKRIGRTFALAAKPVTVAQFLRFHKVHVYWKRFAPQENCPVIQTDWYMAAAYCNWLSQQEDIPEHQWCYETNPQGQVTKLKESYLSR